MIPKGWKQGYYRYQEIDPHPERTQQLRDFGLTEIEIAYREEEPLKGYRQFVLDAICKT